MGRPKLTANIPIESRLAFSVIEVARLVSLCEDMVRREITQGEMGHFRVGNRILVTRQMLDEWLERRAATAAEVRA